jgi:hypothetical protein
MNNREIANRIAELHYPNEPNSIHDKKYRLIRMKALVDQVERELDLLNPSLILKPSKDKGLGLAERTVFTLPSKEGNIFKNWLQNKGYKPSFTELLYEKDKVLSLTDVLYRAFTNEIEFGSITEP